MGTGLSKRKNFVLLTGKIFNGKIFLTLEKFFQAFQAENQKGAAASAFYYNQSWLKNLRLHAFLYQKK